MQVRFLALAFALAGSLWCSGTARAVPVFAAGYGLDTSNAPFDFAVSAPTPVSGGATRQTVNSSGSITKGATASVSAEQGRLRIVNRTDVYKTVQANRVEATASFSGTILFCRNATPLPGALPTSFPAIGLGCDAPTQSFITTLPGLDASGSFSMTNGDSAGTAYGIVSINVFVNGSSAAARSLGATADAAAPSVSASLEDLAGTGLLPTTQATVCGSGTPCSIGYRVAIATITGCASTPGCSAAINMGNSLNFREGVDLFGGLPDGISVWSSDLNIYDNRWYSPETLALLAAASIAEPSSLAALALGLAGLGFTTRRRRRRPRACG